MRSALAIVRVKKPAICAGYLTRGDFPSHSEANSTQTTSGADLSAPLPSRSLRPGYETSRVAAPQALSYTEATSPASAGHE
jgi:hypothetical protein